jgi:hypothetical protein
MGLLLPYAMIALRAKFEFYILAVIFGLSTGPLQAYGRSIYSSITPAGHESEFFRYLKDSTHLFESIIANRPLNSFVFPTACIRLLIEAPVGWY